MIESLRETSEGEREARLNHCSRDSEEVPGLAGHFPVQWMGQACVGYLCALVRKAIVSY